MSYSFLSWSLDYNYQTGLIRIQTKTYAGHLLPACQLQIAINLNIWRDQKIVPWVSIFSVSVSFSIYSYILVVWSFTLWRILLLSLRLCFGRANEFPLPLAYKMKPPTLSLLRYIKGWCERLPRFILNQYQGRGGLQLEQKNIEDEE